jgi:hypothetical protein
MGLFSEAAAVLDQVRQCLAANLHCKTDLTLPTHAPATLHLLPPSPEPPPPPDQRQERREHKFT